ncbi:Ku protein [Parafrigoribacterium mesophilum]
MWKGSIAFGLVNVPVKLYSATESHDVQLHQVHDEDGGRIRYQRRCEVCGKIIDYEHIDKAYDSGDRTVILTDEDFAALPEGRSREIEVVEFVPSEQLDPIMFDRSYFLEPDSKSPKAYTLLRRTLEETDRIAIVHFALRDKTRLGALRVRDDVLMLQSLLWDDEVREAKFPSLDEKVKISDKELEMSSALVDSFASDFTPDDYSDAYQEQLRALIDAKLEHGESVDTEATFGETAQEPAGGEVIDLMEALRRSVEKNRPTKAGATKPDARKSAPKGAGTAKAGSAKSSSRKSATATSAKSVPEESGAAKPRTTKTGGRKRAASDEPEEENATKRTRTRKGA